MVRLALRPMSSLVECKTMWTMTLGQVTPEKSATKRLHFVHEAELRFWTIVAFWRFILATLPWTIGIGKSGIERVQSYWTLWKASLRISVAWTVSGQKQNSQNQYRTFTEHSLNIQHHQQRLLIHKLVGRGSHLQHLDELMAQALTDVCSVTGPLVSGHIMKSKVRRLLCSVGTQLKSKDAQLRSTSESRSQLGTPRCMHPYGSHGLQETRRAVECGHWAHLRSTVTACGTARMVLHHAAPGTIAMRPSFCERNPRGCERSMSVEAKSKQVQTVALRLCGTRRCRDIGWRRDWRHSGHEIRTVFHGATYRQRWIQTVPVSCLGQ